MVEWDKLNSSIDGGNSSLCEDLPRASSRELLISAVVKYAISGDYSWCYGKCMFVLHSDVFAVVY